MQNLQEANVEEVNGAFPMFDLQENGISNADFYTISDLHRLHRELHDRRDRITRVKADIKKGVIILLDSKLGAEQSFGVAEI